MGKGKFLETVIVAAVVIGTLSIFTGCKSDKGTPQSSNASGGGGKS
jgi:hypothetical protein